MSQESTINEPLTFAAPDDFLPSPPPSFRTSPPPAFFGFFRSGDFALVFAESREDAAAKIGAMGIAVVAEDFVPAELDDIMICSLGLIEGNDEGETFPGYSLTGASEKTLARITTNLTLAATSDPEG